MNTTDQTKEAPTLRTDAFLAQTKLVGERVYDDFTRKDLADFARQLERELADALARERGYREAIEAALGCISKARSEAILHLNRALSANPPAGEVVSREVADGLADALLGSTHIFCNKDYACDCPRHKALAAYRSQYPVVKPD